MVQEICEMQALLWVISFIGSTACLGWTQASFQVPEYSSSGLREKQTQHNQVADGIKAGVLHSSPASVSLPEAEEGYYDTYACVYE